MLSVSALTHPWTYASLHALQYVCSPLLQTQCLLEDNRSLHALAARRVLPRRVLLLRLTALAPRTALSTGGETKK